MINRINSSKPLSNVNSDLNKSEKNTVKSNTSSAKTNRKFDNVEVNKLITENEKRIREFKETIQKMVVKQGETYNFTLNNQNLNVSLEDSQKAAESIADGGEFSVDAVATRIMDMAMALSSGDKTKIGLLKDAVIQGFKKAGLEFNNGKGLPDICNKTYDEVMKRFEKWENEE